MALRFPRLTRRRFLRLGLGGAVLVGLGGALAWSTSGYRVDRETARQLRALSPKEFLIVRAALARLVRTDGDDLPSAEDVDGALFVDGLVERMDDGNRGDLLKLLQVLEHVLPAASGHASRFTRLGGEDQDAVLRAMMESPVDALRGAFDALKSLAVMAFFRDPRTWGPIGYDGPFVGRPAGGWGVAP